MLYNNLVLSFEFGVSDDQVHPATGNFVLKPRENYGIVWKNRSLSLLLKDLHYCVAEIFKSAIITCRHIARLAFHT